MPHPPAAFLEHGQRVLPGFARGARRDGRVEGDEVRGEPVQATELRSARTKSKPEVSQ